MQETCARFQDQKGTLPRDWRHAPFYTNSACALNADEWNFSIKPSLCLAAMSVALRPERQPSARLQAAAEASLGRLGAPAASPGPDPNTPLAARRRKQSLIPGENESARGRERNQSEPRDRRELFLCELIVFSCIKPMSAVVRNRLRFIGDDYSPNHTAINHEQEHLQPPVHHYHPVRKP